MKRLGMTSAPKARRKSSVVLAITTLMTAGAASAAEFDTGNSDLQLRWDNTVKYSTARRLKDADSRLTSNVNEGDGDTNFRKAGWISNRLDLLSEIEGHYKDTGIRLSGAAWFDTIYNRRNQNNTAGAFGAGTNAVNTASGNDADKFSSYTSRVNGNNIELLDAFVSQKFDVAGHAATVRVGQHSVTWGETLFLGDNGIAGAMSPVDLAKALSVPNLRFQEILRPVPQVSGQAQLTDDLTALFYYQAMWVPNRSQGSGSYFAPVDFINGGNMIFTNNGTWYREKTRDGENSGQFGVGLKYRGENTDYGLYALRFNSKSSTTVIEPTKSRFYDHYHNGITTVGASANRSLGLFNYAIESSVRNNQNLLSPNAYDTGSGPQYAVGRTFHANLSAFGSNLGRTALWDDAQLLGEAAYSRVLHIDGNENTLSGCMTAALGGACQPNGTRGSWRFQALFEPIYYQVLPGLDLHVPLGITYVPPGSRNMVGPSPFPENAGTLSLGVAATYLDVWRASLNGTHFYGKTEQLYSTLGTGTSQYGYKQYFGDRDYISLSMSRTF